MSTTPLVQTALHDRWAVIVEGVLCHGRTAGPDLGKLLQDEPDFVRGHALKGLSALIMGKAEGRAVARQAIVDAETALRKGSGWADDIHYIRAMRLWLEGRPLEAAATFDRILDRDPLDALAVKLAQSIRFMYGDKQGMLSELAPRVAAFGDACSTAGYIKGCYAFALEEARDYAEAERIGRRAVELAPHDAWGRHAVAHVYEMTGQTRAGLAWLRDAAAWEHCNNFGYHMWWHLALFELERGRLAEVLELYDTRIRAERTDDFRDIANAASLLSRLEFEGVDVGARWQELAERAGGHIDDHCTIFADLHYLMALAGAGDIKGANALAGSLAAHAEGWSETASIARDAGVAMADALLAFHEGRYGAVVDRLTPVLRRFQRVGGSDAQRDVFEQLLIEAAVRAGRTGAAERLLHARLAHRGGQNRFAQDRLARLMPGSSARLGLMAAALLKPARAH